jgi:hypothetical protein
MPPELDLDEPTEDTDKNAIPGNAKKLKLPLPAIDPIDAAPIEPIADEDKTPPSLPAFAPAPKKPSPLRRIKLLRVQPERSSSKLILAIVAALMGVVMVAFAVAPDGKSEREIATREGRPAWEMAESGERPVVSYKDKIQIEHPDMIVRAPLATGDAIQPAPPPENPAPDRSRHAKIERGPPKTPPKAEPRFGFERVQPPQREYDNYDSTKERGTGVPMLMVFSEPRGMSVDVDGRPMGLTPLLRPLPKETKRVKVRVYAAGFKDWEQTVTPNGLEQFRVGVTMQRIAE